MGFLAPFIGPAISAIGGLFHRGGGAAARQDQSQITGAANNLNSIFNYANPTGQRNAATGGAVTGTGLNDLSSSMPYWQTLLKGSRPQVMQAFAPETNAGLNQTDAARRQAVASGTARGGGLAAPMQQQKTNMMSQIDNMLFGARPMAAQQTEQIGGTEAGVGQNMVQQALSLLGLGANSQNAVMSNLNNNQRTQAGITASTVGTATSAAGDLWNNIKTKWPGILGLPAPGGADLQLPPELTPAPSTYATPAGPQP
jgi:hypothetical protein